MGLTVAEKKAKLLEMKSDAEARQKRQAEELAAKTAKLRELRRSHGIVTRSDGWRSE
jgi:hypothetical protein